MWKCLLTRKASNGAWDRGWIIQNLNKISPEEPMIFRKRWMLYLLRLLNDTVDGSEIRLTSWYYSKYPMIYRVSYIYRLVGLGISEPSTVWCGVRAPFSKFLHPKITDAASQVPTDVASARTFGRSRSAVQIAVITRSTMKGRKTYIHVYMI